MYHILKIFRLIPNYARLHVSKSIIPLAIIDLLVMMGFDRLHKLILRPSMDGPDYV